MFIIIIIILIVLVLIFLRQPFNYDYVKGFCGTYFLVQRGNNESRASNIFCELDSRAKNFIECLSKSSFPKKYTERLIKYYASNDLRESTSTYTLNKGDKIHLCIRNHQTGEFFDINTLMFVLIHELTHIADPNYYPNDNHPDSFWKLNIDLLKEAEVCGIYKNVDYRSHPVQYCQMIINENPYF